MFNHTEDANKLYNARYTNKEYLKAFYALMEDEYMTEEEAIDHMVNAQNEVLNILSGESRSYIKFNTPAENWIEFMSL